MGVLRNTLALRFQVTDVGGSLFNIALIPSIEAADVKGPTVRPLHVLGL